MHCSLATGGPGAAMRHAPFGRPRHPLGTFRVGKYLVRPQADRNLPQEAVFLRKAGKRAFLAFFRITKAFASAEATRGLSARPLDPLGGPPIAGGQNLPQGTGFLWKAGKRAFLAFSRITKGFASAEATRGLSARPLDPFGGPPIAGGRNLPQETGFLRKAGKRAYLVFPVSQKVSPLRRRPGGFPFAPWTPSGAHLLQADETSHKKQVSCTRQGKGPILLSPVSQKVSPLRRRPKGFPIALWKPSGPIPVETLA